MLMKDNPNPGHKSRLFIEAIVERQGLKVACVEEIAYGMGYINAAQLEKLARPLMNNSYGQYLLEIMEK